MGAFVHPITRNRAARWCVPPLALASVVTVAFTGASRAAVTTASKTAIVSLGDSFISGEAGRWQGNAVPLNLLGDRWGTDRGAYSCNSSGSVCYHDPARVYGPTATNGCDRSDSAEIQSAKIAVDRPINLACSGATTDNVFRASQGGQSFKGEKPQADQLAMVARDNNVKLVVLSISGNDLGFSDVVKACITRFLTGGQHCNADQGRIIDTRLAQTAPKVTKAVDEIRAVMNNAGYNNGSYRFVLQSYPSPIPSGAENRYPETYKGRFMVGGCPMYNDDSDWARKTVVPKISDMLKKVAAGKNLDFLDLRDLFQGREVCAKDSQQASSNNSLTNPLPGQVSEWARFLVALGSQGTQQESIHPNYYGQLALGACLKTLYNFTGTQKNHACTNTPHKDPTTVVLTNQA